MRSENFKSLFFNHLSQFGAATRLLWTKVISQHLNIKVVRMQQRFNMHDVIGSDQYFPSAFQVIKIEAIEWTFNQHYYQALQIYFKKFGT